MVSPTADSAATEPLAHSDSAPHSLGELERLSREYARTRDPALRETLILSHQRLVRSIASRFLGAGETLEDLVQIGNIGLINALDRFDPDHGTRFSTYATPTILGEIKRHFRDKAGGLKVPRWLQELHQAARRASQQMTGELGRPPTVSEIAARLGTTEEETVQALESAEAQNLLSLDTNVTADGAETGPLMDLIGEVDEALRDLVVYGDLRLALDSLEQREHQVIALRFFQDLSQAKIAKRLNISQMHVSRLQQRALKHLRDILTEERRSKASRRPTGNV